MFFNGVYHFYPTVNNLLGKKVNKFLLHWLNAMQQVSIYEIHKFEFCSYVLLLLDN